MARPKFQPTPDQRDLVRSLVGYGITQEDICRLVKSNVTGKPINDRTLRAYFKEEIAVGSVEAVSTVIQSLYRQAIKGNVGAICFFLKNRAGWRDAFKHEVSGPGGGPVETNVRLVDDRGEIADRIEQLLAEEAERAETQARHDAPGDLPAVGSGVQENRE